VLISSLALTTFVDLIENPSVYCPMAVGALDAESPTVSKNGRIFGALEIKNPPV
jgi:hypothetical protein